LLRKNRPAATQLDYFTDSQGIVGFFGASSIERLPTEQAITACARRFKAIRIGPTP
jgi:predicted TIM-barrel enzyme